MVKHHAAGCMQVSRYDVDCVVHVEALTWQFTIVPGGSLLHRLLHTEIQLTTLGNTYIQMSSFSFIFCRNTRFNYTENKALQNLLLFLVVNYRVFHTILIYHIWFIKQMYFLSFIILNASFYLYIYEEQYKYILARILFLSAFC